MADSQNVQSVVARKLAIIKQSSTESADSASKKSASLNKGEQKLLTSLWKASSELVQSIVQGEVLLVVLQESGRLMIEVLKILSKSKLEKKSMKK